MIIEYLPDDNTIAYSYINILPNQFVSEKKKQSKGWVKNVMDYFTNKAYITYRHNRHTFVKNYDLLKGIIDYEHFYQQNPNERAFAEGIFGEEKLPEYVKHYPIINPPLNTMIGELTKRPDNQKVKAFDADSQQEELAFKTDIMQQYIIQDAKQRAYQKLAMQGTDPSKISDDDLTQMSLENIKDQLTDYTSTAESWGNHILTALKTQFNLKEQSEDAFRDLLTCSREFYGIFEDNSSTGFKCQVVNPKNFWQLTLQDRKYTRDAYAQGTVEVMEISQIIDEFPDLTKDEIDHLTESLATEGFINAKPSNFDRPNAAGIDSIHYNTYDRVLAQEQWMMESELGFENQDPLFGTPFGVGYTNLQVYGYKFIVIRAYWWSKMLVGSLSYQDEQGNVQTMLVDENYKKGTHPGEISVTWGWVNQLYQGTKIGRDVYHVKPFKFLPYFPIIGVIHEIKNTQARSLVDLMKPYQVLYNICLNKLYELLQKDLGILYLTNIRKVPVPKDTAAEDALDIWEENARAKGIVFEDDSPENMKAPSQNQNLSRPIDLSRASEIQSRYTEAQNLKMECWELVGMNRQRLGQSAASSTATSNQNDLYQSFSQTEPYFVAHEYVLNQVYQALIDAAQYVEQQKPTSTVSYISSEGESVFLQIMGQDITLRDLKVFVTCRPEDQQMFNELKQLSQAVIQNGGSIYDIVELYSTNSIRQMKQTFKNLRDRQEALQQQDQQTKQQQLQQQQQQFEEQQKAAQQQHQEDMANDNDQKERDRQSKEYIALIQAAGTGKAQEEDVNGNGVPDVLETSKIQLQDVQNQRQANIEQQKIALQHQQLQATNKNEQEKRKVEREKMQNDKQIAKLRKPTSKK
jgi:hypothetical protein